MPPTAGLLVLVLLAAAEADSIRLTAPDTGQCAQVQTLLFRRFSAGPAPPPPRFAPPSFRQYTRGKCRLC